MEREGGEGDGRKVGREKRRKRLVCQLRPAYAITTTIRNYNYCGIYTVGPQSHIISLYCIH